MEHNGRNESTATAAETPSVEPAPAERPTREELTTRLRRVRARGGPLAEEVSELAQAVPLLKRIGFRGAVAGAFESEEAKALDRAIELIRQRGRQIAAENP